MGVSISQFTREMSVLIPTIHQEFLKKQSRIFKTGDITFAQLGILQLLRDRQSCMMSEIARFFSITTSAATGMVDRMVRSGYLKRVYVPSDRRRINVKLTPRGRKAIDTMAREQQRAMTDIFKKFTPKEREIYLNTVKKIHTIVTRGRR